MDTSLYKILTTLLEHTPPASTNHYVTRGVGFYTTNHPHEAWTVICHQNRFELIEGIQKARQVIVGDLARFAQLPVKIPLEELTLIPADWRLYLPPPLRPILGLHETEYGDLPLAVHHVYPVALNPYLVSEYKPSAIPDYAKAVLPQLIADDHPDWVAMYDYAWQKGFQNLRQPEVASGFVANFIDTAFNTNTFLWDSCFMMMFGRYARQHANFMGTLNNFYAKQHADGFICREINTFSGYDLFEAYDARSTGPNILAWTEWLDFQLSHDVERLNRVFPALIAFHQWWRAWRTWPDGTYWTSGLGSGMDNQARVPDSGQHHRHYAWLDATAQQALNCKILLQMAGELDWHEFDADLQTELENLTKIVNETMWDDVSGFYYDRAPDGSLSSVKSIGAYWALLAGIVPPERAERMLDHLQDEKQFKRPHRIPSQSADSTSYRTDGNYWLGGVWSPTNYMVLQALSDYEQDDLAFKIALNHVQNVSEVFKNTGTLWENYAPEMITEGAPAKPDFVGWTGVSAITIPIEYLVGLRWENNVLIWNINLIEQHGVIQFPVGLNDKLDAICSTRQTQDETPHIKIITSTPIHLEVRWKNQRYRYELDAGTHEISL